MGVFLLIFYKIIQYKLNIMKEYKSVLFIILSIFAILGVLFWISSAYSGKGKALNPNGSAGALAAEEKFFDFGEISMVKGKVKHNFKVKNLSANPVNIEKIYTSCMCTSAAFVLKDKRLGPFGMPGHGIAPKIDQIISPSEEAVIEAEFDPNAHGPAGVGGIQRAIYVETENGDKIELGFKAIVAP